MGCLTQEMLEHSLVDSAELMQARLPLLLLLLFSINASHANASCAAAKCDKLSGCDSVLKLEVKIFLISSPAPPPLFLFSTSFPALPFFLFFPLAPPPLFLFLLLPLANRRSTPWPSFLSPS